MSTADKVETVSEVISQVSEQRRDGPVELNLSEEKADQVVAGLTLYRQEVDILGEAWLKLGKLPGRHIVAVEVGEEVDKHVLQ